MITICILRAFWLANYLHKEVQRMGIVFRFRRTLSKTRTSFPNDTIVGINRRIIYPSYSFLTFSFWPKYKVDCSQRKSHISRLQFQSMSLLPSAIVIWSTLDTPTEENPLVIILRERETIASLTLRHLGFSPVSRCLRPCHRRFEQASEPYRGVYSWQTGSILMGRGRNISTAESNRPRLQGYLPRQEFGVEGIGKGRLGKARESWTECGGQSLDRIRVHDWKSW